MNKVKYFINSYHTRIKAGLVAMSLLITTGCTALVGPKDDGKDHDHDHDLRPGVTEVGGLDHNHDIDDNIVEEEPVKNVQIEIKPGVVIEVDGSLFPNVDNLNNDEIKAILEDLEKHQKEEGKAPIVDPSISRPESSKPSKPVRPSDPDIADENHNHEFGDWYAYSDDLEARECKCGEIETRAHTLEQTKTSYATYSDGTHYEVDTLTCSNCGHKVYNAHKENCEYRFQDYDEDYEHHICDDCGYINKVEHKLEIVNIDYENVATYACQNEGCAYTFTRELKPETPIKPGFPDHESPLPHKHSFTVWKALNDNLETRFCLGCDKVESRPHDFETKSITYKNQGESGHKRLTLEKCKNDTCGHEKTTESKILGHDLKATNNADGSTTYDCTTGCGYTKTIQNTEHTTHNWVETSRSVGTSASENEHFTNLTYTCTIGGEIKIEMIKESCSISTGSTSTSKFDDNSHWIETKGNCECGNAITNISQKQSHKKTSSQKYENKGEQGHILTTYEKCACGYDKTKTGNLTNHSLDKGTLNEDGSTTYKCTTGCGYTKVVTKDHSTHDWVKYDEKTTPNGKDQHKITTYYKCSCGETKTEENVYSCTAKPGTGTSTTKYNDSFHWTETTGLCTCGNSVTSISNKVSHSLGEWTPISDKEEMRSCSGCGFTEKRTIAHSHNWVETGKTVGSPASDSSHNVIISFKCSCGETKKENQVVNCTMVDAGSVSKFDSSSHWTETQQKCACGNSKTVIGNKVPHSLGEWIPISDTEEMRSCNGCGFTEKRTIAHSHNWVETGRTIGSPSGDSSHNVKVSFKCSCGETKTEDKVESCSMTNTGNSISKYDSSGHWTETQQKCACGNTKNVKSEVSSHNMTSTTTGAPTQYNESQHRIPTVSKCSCGYSSAPTYTYESHSWTETDMGDYILYTCVCGEHKEVEKEQHGDHRYRVDSMTNNGNGTHTIAYTCTNTKGTCDAPTYSETLNHSYTSSEMFGIITYTCACGDSYTETITNPEPEPEPEHEHRWSPNGMTNNGDGTHTTSYTCTSTIGECPERTKTETSGHSYTASEMFGIITYTCACGDSYVEVAGNDSIEDDDIVASVTSQPSVDEILASSKSVQDILKDAATVEDILAGTASVEDTIAAAQASEQDKQNDQGDAYTIRPL